MVSQIKIFAATVLTFLLLSSHISYGQADQQLRSSQQFRLGDGIIRVAEPGQLADSVNVWGDIPRTGRYLIPEGTSLPELMSYAGGPRGLETDIFNISNVKIKVNISRYSPAQEKETEVSNFEFRYKEPIPAELYRYDLKNNDVVSIEVRRRANFLDYFRVIGPIITTFTSIVILSDRL